ncbi:hypothetical protein BGZ96_010927 [Linnemannia gamsii]|uniref:Uncharacterized protein n=1 Tax=Linnemannia gamsii TaxID=64522 RepID=A0ABQ7KDI1_9FUNG|nr:hypothetical protein BGZ96_010927 [Linnemannia gamsii]
MIVPGLTMTTATIALAPIAGTATSLDEPDGSASRSRCGHYLHNVQGVKNWHRFRVEMLRQTVEETCQSLVLEPALDRYDLRGNSGLRPRLKTQSRQSSRIVRHHYTQRACFLPTPPIRHPNQSSQDEFRHVLLQVDWDAIWSRELVGRSDTIARLAEPTRREDALLETNEGFAGSPHEFFQDHHQNLRLSGNTTHLDEEQHPAVDTFPSSAGIRVKPLQPNYIDPRLKFPTVYEIDSCSKGEGVNVLNEVQGVQLSRHPYGQVKVIRSPISGCFVQNRRSLVRNSINDREEAAAILDGFSIPVANPQAEETNRYCSFYADLPFDSTPHLDVALPRLHSTAANDTFSQCLYNDFVVSLYIDIIRFNQDAIS